MTIQTFVLQTTHGIWRLEALALPRIGEYVSYGEYEYRIARVRYHAQLEGTHKKMPVQLLPLLEADEFVRRSA